MTNGPEGPTRKRVFPSVFCLMPMIDCSEKNCNRTACGNGLRGMFGEKLEILHRLLSASQVAKIC